MHAIEVTGMIDEKHQLRLDEPLPLTGRVRVIVLFPESDEINDSDWAKAASRNPAYDFLREDGEDIYTATDGKPFHDQG
jgi:hypothetical protein